MMNKIDKKLANALVMLAALDQRMRKKAIKTGRLDNTIDRKNTKKLKKSWPNTDGQQDRWWADWLALEPGYWRSTQTLTRHFKRNA